VPRRACDRRALLLLLAGAAAWPSSSRAQARARRKRIGVLMRLTPDDTEGEARLAAFHQGLQEVGLNVGRNVEVDYRWGPGDAELRRHAAELVALKPDVLMAAASSPLAALQAATRTIPIVFAQVTDPVGGGHVASLARPGGNTTGFSLFEYGVSGKWLELIRELAPGVKRVLVLRDPALTASIAQLGALQSAAPALGLEVAPAGRLEPDAIERDVDALARNGHGGLVVTVGAAASQMRELIIALAVRHRLPAIYPFRYYAAAGGLISYGPDTLDQFRRAAGYVERILKGESPAALPVQAPTRYELVLNLRTARAMGIDMPAMLLARADEVIE
jgi:putative ABC transport system substrate-binding protein